MKNPIPIRKDIIRKDIIIKNPIKNIKNIIIKNPPKFLKIIYIICIGTISTVLLVNNFCELTMEPPFITSLDWLFNDSLELYIFHLFLYIFKFIFLIILIVYLNCKLSKYLWKKH